MGTITLDLSAIVNGSPNDATPVSTALSTVQTWANGNVNGANLKNEALLTATKHGAVAGGTDLHDATAVSYSSTASGMSGVTEVDGALDKIVEFTGMDLPSPSAGSGTLRFIYDSASDVLYHATTPSSCQVTIPAGTTTKGIVAVVSAFLNAQSSADSYEAWVGVGLTTKKGANPVVKLWAEDGAATATSKFAVTASTVGYTGWSSTCEKSILNLPTDTVTWDNTEDVIVSLDVKNGGTGLGTGTAAIISLKVYAII